MSRKKGLSQQFDQLIQTENISLSLDKLIGDTTHPLPTATLAYDTTLSIDTLAASLGCAQESDATDMFIQKYGTTYYPTLDALIEASLTIDTAIQSYTDNSKRDASQLFEGLGDLLED